MAPRDVEANLARGEFGRRSCFEVEPERTLDLPVVLGLLRFVKNSRHDGEIAAQVRLNQGSRSSVLSSPLIRPVSRPRARKRLDPRRTCLRFPRRAAAGLRRHLRTE